MLLKNPLIYAVSYIIKPTVESTRLCVTMLIFTKVVKSSQSRSKSELNNIKNKCKEVGLVEADFSLRHFVVFLPAGIVFSVDADGEEGEIGESFVELAAEDVGGESVENPVALIVAGKNAGEHCHWVFAESRLQGVLHLLHECGGLGVRHAGSVAMILPCNFDAYAETRI